MGREWGRLNAFPILSRKIMLYFSIIILIYLIVLFLLSLTLHNKQNYGSVNHFIFAKKEINAFLIVPSIFNSWVWVTSLIGAAEALILYGISGGITYAFGAGGAFLIFTFFISHFKRNISKRLFINEYVSSTFSHKEGIFLTIISVIIMMYIIIEMAVGVGFVFNGLFGVSFKITAFLSVLIAAIFVQHSGTKVVLVSDLISFVIVIFCFLYLSVIVFSTFELSFIREQLNLLSKETENINYLAILSKGSLRYLISAIIVGIAQLILDPSYYLKAALLNDTKSLVSTFIIGGVLMFVPITLLGSIIFGATYLSLGYDYSNSVNQSTTIATKMLVDYFNEHTHIIMGIMIFLVAITTMISEFLGLLSLATIYISKNITGNTDEEQIRFGRILTVIVGIITSLTAISLEKVSLLTLDIFFGIALSAVAGTVLCRLNPTFKKNKLSIVTIILLGIVSGFLIWIMTKGNWYFATLASFLLPPTIVFFEYLLSCLLRKLFP